MHRGSLSLRAHVRDAKHSLRHVRLLSWRRGSEDIELFIRTLGGK